MPFIRSRKKKSARELALKALHKMPKKRMRQGVVQGTPAFTSSWQQVHVTAVATGDDEFSREGDTMLVDELRLRYIISSATALGSAAACRVVLVQDRQSNGASPSNNQIFTQNNSVKAHQDPTFSRRYRILFDRTHMLNEFASNTSVISKTHGKFVRRYKSELKVRYIGASSAVTDISSGAIYLLYICDNPGNPPSINYEVLTRFHSP